MCSAAVAVLLLAAPKAMADCASSGNGGAPDTIVCSGADTNGITYPAFDTLNVTINPGASVTDSGTNMNLSVTRFGVAPVFNFDMNAPNSVIAGDGTQLDVLLISSPVLFGPPAQPAIATFNIAGDIESTGGNAIALTMGGTATFNIASTSNIEAAGNGITINNIALPGNTTVNNAGQIYGGTDGSGNGIEINRLLGAGSIAVHNTGVIGSTAQPVGSTAIAIFATDPNGNDVVVTNAPSALPNAVLGSGTIYSTGNSINITQLAGGGGTEVTNSGSITSTGGQAINILKLNGDTKVENAAGGEITSLGTSINITQGGGTTNVKNFGDITSSNGSGVNIVKLVGDTTVTNRTDASIKSKGTAINIDQGGGITTVQNDGAITSTSGLGVDVLNAAGPISVTNSKSIIAGAGGIRGVAVLGTAEATNSGTIKSGGDGVNLVAGVGNVTATNTTGASIDAAGDGINVTSLLNDAAVYNDGHIDADGDGVSAVALGNVTVTNTSLNSIVAIGNGITVDAGLDANVTNSGAITATNGIGIGTLALRDTTIDHSGTINSTNGPGIIALGGNDITIRGNGAVATTFGSVESDGVGILAVSGLLTGGSVSIDAGTVTSHSSTGIAALAIDGGSTVNLHGDVQANGLFGVASAAIDLGPGSGDSAVNLGGKNVTNDGGIGVFSLAALGHSSVTGGAGGTVKSATTGIVSTSLFGDSTVASGNVEAGGSGILSTAIDGKSTVTLGGDVTANGTFGVFSAALDLGPGTGDSTVDLGGKNVTNTGGTGVFSLAALGNSSVTNGGTGTITSADAGVVSTSLLGSSTVDVNNVKSGGTGIVSTAAGGDSNATARGDITSASGSGIISTAIGGNATATNFGTVSADNGLYGIAAFAIDGDATATANGAIDPPLIGVSSFTIGSGTATSNVNNTVQAWAVGAYAGNIGSGDVVVNVNPGGSIQSDYLGILATNIGPGDTTVTVDGAVGGYTGTATGDDAINVTNFINNGDITVTTTAAGTLAAGDDAVDITKIGGGGKIDVALGADATASDDGVTIFRTLSGLNTNGENNIGVGVAGGKTLTATNGNGIDIVTPLAHNDIAVTVGAGASVLADNGSAVSVLGFSLLGDNAVSITNAGTLQGDGTLFDPTIRVATDGAVNITNQTGGKIQSDGGSTFASVIQSTSGVSNTVQNDGTITGNMQLAALGDNTVVNNSATTWNTSGLNLYLSGTKNLVENTSNGVVNAGPFTVFAMIGPENEIRNAGEFNSTGFNVYGMFGNDNAVNNSGAFNVTGYTQFLGGNFGGQNLAFNNAGGVLSMQNTISDYGFFTPVDFGFEPYGNGIGDVTQIGFLDTTGNTFNGGAGSRYAIDAFLDAPTTSSSDLLIVNGDTTGVTALQVQDTNAGPGSYNPTGILVAHIEGNSDADAFYLEGGPIDKGLFTYDLYRVEVASFDWLLASTPDQTFFELPHLITAAQNMWHNSAGVWLDRTADLRASVSEKCAVLGSLKDSAAVCTKSVTPGAWAKVLGNTMERDQSYDYTILGKTSTFQVNSRQDGYGIVGGYDVGHETSSGAWMIGAMGGYVASNLDFDNSTTDVDYRTGLVGAYATWIEGGWFVDGKVLANIGKYEYANATNNGLSTHDKQNVLSVGGVVDTGYRMTYASGFIEPGATLAYVNSDLDDATIYGTAVHFEDGSSLRGRLGVRVGTTYVSGGHKLEPFIGASAWHEFDADNKISLSSGGYDLTANDDASGTFGEVTGGLNIFSLGSDGISGFVKGNAQFGEDNLRGYSGNAGVRVNW